MDTISCFSETRGNSILYTLDFPRSLKKYFLSTSGYIRYDSKINLEKIDKSILSIPVVSALSPIAWATGANMHVPSIDADYLRSLENLRDLYRQFFPRFTCAGSIRTDRVVKNGSAGNRDAILYSGGVDSLATYLRHKQEKPDLISIWGTPDIPCFEEKFWNRMWNSIAELAARDGLQAFQVKTDMYRSINHELLNWRFNPGPLQGGWWGGFASVLFLSGMSAPAASAIGANKLLIASSYPPGYKGVGGFHSSIINGIRFAGIPVVQDNAEQSRQQKINYISQTGGRAYLSHLRVCFDTAGETNCGQCEKCSRTITALAVAGMDPNECNFKVTSKTFKVIKKRLTSRTIGLYAGARSFWTDIQEHIPEKPGRDFHGSRSFLVWLKTFDLTHYRTNNLRNRFWMALVLTTNRRLKFRAIWRRLRCYSYMVTDLRK